MNPYKKLVLDIALYIVLFVAIQLVVTIALAIGFLLYKGLPFTQIQTLIATDLTLTIAANIVGSALLAVLFCWRKWTPVSRHYVQSRPWGVLFWVLCIALGAIIPAMAFENLLPFELPIPLQVMLTRMMHHPLGYVAIGIFAPLAEEIVFRGAILRRLLAVGSPANPWIAITISALLFGLIHLNFAQGVHAFLMGLPLGWLYVRTRSIIPGIAFHWVNNSVVYLLAHLMPGYEDASLRELANGSTTTMLLYIFFSLCILIPSLLQVYNRTRQ